jgi:Anti-sigma-K factor rskA
MFQARRSAMRRLGRHPDSSHTQASASGRLRERVLAGVRGEPLTADRLRGPRKPLVPAITLLAGIALGAVLVLAVNSGGHEARRSIPSQSEARASLREVGDRAELLVSGMPEPPVGEVYELWVLRRGSSPQATDALFTVTYAGAGTVDVPGGVGHGVREVMVTREPLGGSTSPTSPPVLRVKVPGIS